MNIDGLSISRRVALLCLFILPLLAPDNVVVPTFGMGQVQAQTITSIYTSNWGSQPDTLPTASSPDSGLTTIGSGFNTGYHNGEITIDTGNFTSPQLLVNMTASDGGVAEITPGTATTYNTNSNQYNGFTQVQSGLYWTDASGQNGYGAAITDGIGSGAGYGRGVHLMKLSGGYRALFFVPSPQAITTTIIQLTVRATGQNTVYVRVSILDAATRAVLASQSYLDFAYHPLVPGIPITSGKFGFGGQYSTFKSLSVSAYASGGTLSAGDVFVQFRGRTGVVLGGNRPSGGSGTYTSQWQYKLHSASTWANFPGAAATQYTLYDNSSTLVLGQSYDFRRADNDGANTAYSATLTTGPSQVGVLCVGDSNTEGPTNGLSASSHARALPAALTSAGVDGSVFSVGQGASTYSNQIGMSANLQTMANAWPIDLILENTGTNEASAGQTKAQYKSGIQSVIDMYQGFTRKLPVMLVGSIALNDGSTSGSLSAGNALLYNNYLPALQELVANDSGTAVAGSYSDFSNTIGQSNLYQDGLHLNATGYNTTAPAEAAAVSTWVSAIAPPVTVTGVTVSPSNATYSGAALPAFTATVTGSSGVSQAVTWSISPAAAPTVSASGSATIPNNLTYVLTATSTADPTKNGTASIVVPVASGTAAAPPLLLTITHDSSGHAILSWTDGSPGSGYKILKSTDGATYTALYSVGPSIRTYTIPTLTTGTVYYQVVRTH